MATPKSNIIRLRLTDLEKAEWQKAAGSPRGLSDWIRRVCNAAAVSDALGQGDADAVEKLVTAGADAIRAAEKTSLSTDGAVFPERAGYDTKLDAPEMVSYETPQHTIVTRPLANGGCPRAHHHRPGRYCGTCKKLATKVGE